MARHKISAAKPRPAKPKAEIRAAPSWYDRTHPVGSAERFLDEAAKEALAAAAAGGVITPRQAAAGAVRAVAKKASEYPDPLLQRAAELPAAELAKRAARAEAYNQAMKAQNGVVQAMTASMSPVADLARSQASAALATRQAAKGGDAGAGETPVSETPVSAGTAPSGGPRIVINPTTFKNSKDALCVAFNEGFRLWMETSGFEPQSEPTDAQRRFFSDTAYADNEVQLRRTILARIATFDTSVKDPTDDQLSETASFLNEILESDWCKNEWERDSVSRLAKAVEAAVGAEPVEPRAAPLEPREPEPLRTRAAEDGGRTRRTLAMNGPSPEPARRIGDIGAGTLTTDPKRMNGPSIEPERPIGDVGELSFTDTGSMNGPSIEPARRIGDIGAKTLADPKRMNGPSIEPARRIGDIGARTLADPKRMNGPSIGPERPIGDVGDLSFTDTGSMNGPALGPERPIGDAGEVSFTDTKRMNGPALKPARRIGDLGARSLSPTTVPA